jgi:hypothetical protein
VGIFSGAAYKHGLSLGSSQLQKEVTDSFPHAKRGLVPIPLDHVEHREGVTSKEGKRCTSQE